MEKFSAYRDPGTGIQPFLAPISPGTSGVLLPLRYVLAMIRTAFILTILAIYVALVHGFCLCLIPIPYLHRRVTHVLTAILGRTALFFLGFFWISVEYAPRKRRRGDGTELAWNPCAGDIIISNWVSWIELVWLAIRLNPIFVLPVSEQSPETNNPSMISSRHRGARQTAGTNAPASRIPINVFQKLSLLSIISRTARVPFRPVSWANPSSLDDIRKRADRPIVVFPECTTSNGRGLLRFSALFHQNVPVKGYQVFIMSVRYDSPSTFVPATTHCIPNYFLNPLPHLFRLATALKPIGLHIRLLAPSDSPSSQLFMTSEVIFGTVEDQLAESSAVLISQLGKLKRTNLGWEEKAAFLNFYYNRNR
ncbi:hypothetical protein APHAL10511_001781 [Amanita phalloides]|nr:hypothetical protein APHAL10511_001781 [Amanita phalloides]